MSNILRTKNGNLSKVKYFLPAYRNQNEESTTYSMAKSKASQSVSKKQSSANHTHNQSTYSNGDISFEVIGIHENSEAEAENNTFIRSKNIQSNESSQVDLSKRL
jgi:hypothetical protein